MCIIDCDNKIIFYNVLFFYVIKEEFIFNYLSYKVVIIRELNFLKLKCKVI